MRDDFNNFSRRYKDQSGLDQAYKMINTSAIFKSCSISSSKGIDLDSIFGKKGLNDRYWADQHGQDTSQLTESHINVSRLGA